MDKGIKIFCMFAVIGGSLFAAQPPRANWNAGVGLANGRMENAGICCSRAEIAVRDKIEYEAARSFVGFKPLISRAIVTDINNEQSFFRFHDIHYCQLLIIRFQQYIKETEQIESCFVDGEISATKDTATYRRHGGFQVVGDSDKSTISTWTAFFPLDYKMIIQRGKEEFLFPAGLRDRWKHTKKIQVEYFDEKRFSDLVKRQVVIDIDRERGLLHYSKKSRVEQDLPVKNDSR